MAAFNAARTAMGIVAAGALGIGVGSIVACSPRKQLFSARIIGRQDVASTRWLKLQTIEYVDQTGKQRMWDQCSRTTRVDSASVSGVDAVVILARLSSRNDPQSVYTLVVQQFRPPVGKVTIELPAGLIDKGESPEQAALRELKEETGYVGSVVSCSGPICMSPGLSDETVKLVTVDVDLDLPANRSPKQALEETEFIQVHRVPIRSLAQELRKMEAEGAMPIEGLHLFAAGLQIGQGLG